MKYYDYQVLNIDKLKFSEINLKDIFFDSLKTDYNQLKFSDWFKSKQDKMNMLLFTKIKIITKLKDFYILKLKTSMKTIMTQLFLNLNLKSD